MKSVDSIKPVSGKSFNPRLYPKVSVEARVSLNNDEYFLVEKVYNWIISNKGCLNEKQQQEFAKVKKLLRKFKKDYRCKQLELDAKEKLLESITVLKPSDFVNQFHYLQHFMSKTIIRGIFEKIYLSLNSNKQLENPYYLDILTRFYIERLQDVFEALKPHLTYRQKLRWQNNIAPRIKWF